MIRLRKSDRKLTSHFLPRMLLIALSVSTLTSSVRADGGTVLCQRTTGHVLVTTFTAQTPLRIGRADISVLVESVGEPHPIVDAQVFIKLENEAGATVSAEATHDQARNKLLYCSLINIPEAGHWTMKIIVQQGAEKAEVLHDLTVAKPEPLLFAYWKLIAFPPMIMILFVTNQWLGRNRKALTR